MLVDFYHLTDTPLERVLPSICEKLLGRGERLLVVASPDLLVQLDAQLWAQPKDGFLPHGRSDGLRPESQPILLSAEPEALNGALNVALADGQWRDEALSFARTFYFFDAATLSGARQAWRALRGKEAVESRYWKQDDARRWVQGP